MKPKAKLARTHTEYEVTLQRRDGKNMAVIEAQTVDTYEDGRGYAGQDRTNLQVLIVPLSSLAGLADQIVRTLTYNTTADPEERYDLDTDAIKRIGLYQPGAAALPVETFYTVAEGRMALQSSPSGYVLAHLPKDGEDFRSILYRNE